MSPGPAARYPVLCWFTASCQGEGEGEAGLRGLGWVRVLMINLTILLNKTSPALRAFRVCFFMRGPFVTKTFQV